MKKIQVLGGGCSKCKILAEEIQKAADEMGVEIEVEKVTDYQQIMAFGVMTTPALVVDGKVMFSGKVVKANDLKLYLKS